MPNYIKTESESGEARERIPVTQLGLLAVPQIERISATAYTLSDDHHGKILDFTAAGSVTVTVPAGLPSDFVCGISQGGAGQVTLSAGDGVTINEVDGNLSTEGQYVTLSLVAFAANTFRLFGRTA